MKFDLAFNNEKPDPDAVATLFQDSVFYISQSSANRQPVIAEFVGERLHLRRENDYAVKMMERFFPPIQLRGPNENNSIAYFRSLTRKGLETALMEIDAALVADGTSRAEFLDTKAWVLHGLGQDATALPFIQESLKKIHSQLKQIAGVHTEDRAKFLAFFISDIEDSTREDSTTEDSAENDSTAAQPKNRLDELKNQLPYLQPLALELQAERIASVRFHRACILDELGRTEESELDYRWLDRFGFTEPDKLN